MTLLRQPATFERALSKIASLLGWDGCAAVLEKSESYVRKLGAPDTEREISLRDALRLDAAWRRAGGDGAPLFECYALQLDMDSGGAMACANRMIAAAALVSKESGEAVAAALALASNMDDAKVQRKAAREIEEAISHLTHLMKNVKTIAKRNT